MQTTEYISPEMPENRSCNMRWGRQGGKGPEHFPIPTWLIKAVMQSQRSDKRNYM